MKLRPLIGAVLSLLLVGELLVSSTTGLFAPAALLVFLALYVCYFYVVDAYVQSYHPNWWQLTLFNTALYSILITGFFHAELLDLRSDGWLMSLAVRLQSGLAVLFVYLLLRRIPLAQHKTVSLQKAMIWLGIYFLLMSPIGQLGVMSVIHVVTQAPAIAALAAVVAAAMLTASFRGVSAHHRTPKAPLWPAIPFVVAACIPVAWLFPYYVIAMCIGGVLLLVLFGREVV